MDKSLLKILEGHSEEAARYLLGCTLTRQIGDKTIRAEIVETESYHQTDVASHSFNGMTPRTEIMFGEAGKLYVYFTYGMHYCCNIVTGKAGEGSAVLIRAVSPISGEELMLQNRKGKSGYSISNGPAKVCQAMAIDKSLNGHDLSKVPLILERGREVPSNDIVSTTRIGISKGKEKLWRFYIKNNPYVSYP